MTQRTVVFLSMALFGALLIWGVFTTIVYIGVPAHGAVYMSQEQLQAIGPDCSRAATISSYWCRGWETIGPMMSALVSTTKPFHAYIIISILAYIVVVGWRGYTRGRFVFMYTMRPWHVIGGFALSVWLIATLLSIGSTYRQEEAPPFRRVYEPLPQVYEGLGDEALEVLNANFDDLESRNCLMEIGTTQNGARIFNLKNSCIQISLFTIAGGQLILLLFLTLNFLIAGRGVLRFLKWHHMPPLLLSITCLGLGSFLWTAALWILAVSHLLTQIPVALLFLGLPLALFPDTLYWFRTLRDAEWDMDGPNSHLLAFLGWLLISYLALNYLNVLRPFPIGWDDLGSYLNRPKLLASYGAFIPQMAPFQWEYLTAMPFVLFGNDSLTGTTFALLVNWLAGVLGVLCTYAITRTFLGRGAGLCAAMLYYFLPMVGHFSFADMKIDNASYFASALAIYLGFVFLFGTPHTSEDERVYPWNFSFLILAGIIAGFGFGIKATGILTILMIASCLVGGVYGAWGFAGASFTGFVILSAIGPLKLHNILEKIGFTTPIDTHTIDTIGVAIFATGALLTCAIAWFRHQDKAHVNTLLKGIGTFSLGLFISMAPWMAHNAISNGRVTPTSMLGYNDNLVPYISYGQESEVPANLDPRVDKRFLTPDLKLNPADPACTISASAEELDRYWGFGNNWQHYATLPWRAVMNSDIVGYYVTLVPILLLIPCIFLLPAFWRPEGKWIRLISVGSLIFFLQWMFVANGIIWYGIGMFLGFVVIIETMLVKAPDKLSRSLMSVFFAVSIIVALLNRMWQFDVQKNLFEYPLGKASEATIREVTIPYYDDIRDEVLARNEMFPDRPYAYRIGTFIAYFIPRNKEIIPNADHQLQFFNCLNQERDHALTLRRLQQLGFNSIIFDTNTATIEKDPNGTLHQKVNAFLDFAHDQTLGLDVMIDDSQAGIMYVKLP